MISGGKILCVLGLCFWVDTQALVHVNLIGDVGIATYKTPSIARSQDSSQVKLPYVYADYKNYYARVDTFGYKLIPLGAGNIELSTRLSFEGFKPENASIQKRSRPLPIGIGTFQETRYGAFIAYAFRDSVSGGNLIDVNYALEWSLGKLNIYPQLGIERRDHKYVNFLYGVSSYESQQSGLRAYSPSNSVTPSTAIAFEYPLMNNTKLTLQIKRKWLDRKISESPLVDIKTQTSNFLAISQSFN